MNIPGLVARLTRRHVVLKNAFWLTIAIGVAGAADFLLTIYVIRKFGAVRYGVFGYAFSFASLFSALFDVGLAMTITREFAAVRAKESHFGSLLTLKGLVSIAGVIIVCAGGILVTRDPFARRMIFLLSFYVALVELVNFLYALFRSRQKMEIEAGFRFLYAACLILLVIGLTSLRPSILSVGLAYCGAITFTAVSVFTFFWRFERRSTLFRPRVAPLVWRTYLLIGFYIALNRTSGDINQYIGAVTLGYLGRLAEIGWYNAADKIYGVILFPMALISSAIFPALAEAHQNAPERFARYWREWMRATIVLSTMLALITVLKAGDIIGLLYPRGFSPAVWTLQILVAAASCVYLQSPYYHALLVVNRQRELFLAGLAATAVHVILNFILVPPYGLYGVAFATLLSQFAMLAQCVFLTSRYGVTKLVSPELLQAFLISGISAVGMIIVLAAVPQGRVGLVVAVPVGVLVYLALVAVCMQFLRRRVARV